MPACTDIVTPSSSRRMRVLQRPRTGLVVCSCKFTEAFLLDDELPRVLSAAVDSWLSEVLALSPSPRDAATIAAIKAAISAEFSSTPIRGEVPPLSHQTRPFRARSAVVFCRGRDQVRSIR